MVQEGKYTSRKFWAYIITSVLVVFAGALAGFFPALTGQLAIVVGGLITAYTVYAGANVMYRHVSGKQDEPEEPDGSPPDLKQEVK